MLAYKIVRPFAEDLRHFRRVSDDLGEIDGCPASVRRFDVKADAVGLNDKPADATIKASFPDQSLQAL